MPTAADEPTAALACALARENAELRHQLDAARKQLVEAAGEAGELHARIRVLHADLVEARAGRDAWRAEAERQVGWGARTA